MAKRYFIVAYEASCDQGRIMGDVPFTSESGKYINQKTVTKYITDQGKDNKLGKIRNLVFRNIIELRKADFDEYIR